MHERETNAQILISTLEAHVAQRRKEKCDALRGTTSRGGPPSDLQNELAALDKRINSMQAMERVARDLLNWSEQLARRESETGSRQRRFHAVTGLAYHHQLKYAPKHPFRTRLYAASSPAAQVMDRRMQKILLGHTWDFDIVNCMPTLLYQMLERLEILPVEVWRDDLDLLRTVVQDRAAFAEAQLAMTPAQGKATINALLHGSGLPQALQRNVPAVRLQRLARFLRWVACSVSRDVFDGLNAMTETSETRWPEASTLAHMWQGVEDHVLHAMLGVVMTRPVEHVSLHFDGLRVDRPRVKVEARDEGDGVAEMCGLLQEGVKTTTGYEVKVVVKEHLTLNESVRRLHSEPQHETIPDYMLRPGNCIPLSMGSVTGDRHTWPQFAEPLPPDAARAHIPTRRYREVALDMHKRLVAFSDTSPLSEGRWLIHAEDSGHPHCIGVHVRTATECTLYFGNQQCTMPLRDLQSMLMTAIDKKLHVLFRICDEHEHDLQTYGALRQLLELHAGAASDEEGGAKPSRDMPTTPTNQTADIRADVLHADSVGAAASTDASSQAMPSIAEPPPGQVV